MILIELFVPGLGSRAVGDIVASMSEDTGAGDHRATETVGVGVGHPLIKTETGASPSSQPPGLIPIPLQDAVSASLSAEKQQVRVIVN